MEMGRRGYCLVSVVEAVSASWGPWRHVGGQGGEGAASVRVEARSLGAALLSQVSDIGEQVNRYDCW